MNVLFVAAEVAPYIKTGGLADVAGALPAALRAAGHDVRVVMPYYRQLRERGVAVTGPIAATFLPVGDRAEELRMWQLTDSAVPTYLLDIPAAFERGSIYGDGDDDRRFILFARGVLALMQQLRETTGWQAELVHAHDWHAALVSNYIKTFYAYTFGHIATVFTIHNLQYQGQFSPASLNTAGLAERGLIENGMGPGTAGTFNFMARGISYSDVVSTVSPTYAQEIMTGEYGERLDGLLRSRRERVTGILNGIDGNAFNPATDAFLAQSYSSDDVTGKLVCKRALQVELGLATSNTRPLLGIVSRLVEQKGIDLLDAAIPWLMLQTDAQLVVLGSGQPYLQDALTRHAAAHPGRIAVRLGFDAGLAQRIYAGSDGFLMPSRFEPCGLGQMIALRYGSVPIVRATGGLNDTVREGWDGNGFVFHQYEPRHFIDAIDRALTAYRETKSWAILRDRGMREDNSWTNAAQQYMGVYEWARRLQGG
ncbi:MAG: glycogen synthase [Gemmatimonadaceae bacterium]|nr:glycogen synthase [Gemmatimonadaceae bacterium]